MSEKRFDILDYLILLVRWKKLLLAIFLLVAGISYTIIYFFVEEEYESTSIIIPSEDQTNPMGAAGLLKNIKNLSFDMSMNSNPETDLYNTIIYSRNNLENLIRKFDLLKNFGLDTTAIDYKEKALKRLSTSIIAKETKDKAYSITVIANSPKLAANMANYIVSVLNKKIIELKVAKSKQNREFLENRLADIKARIANSEDSLRMFQEKSGMLDVEQQMKGIIGAYSNLETALITKQIEQSILSNMLDKDSPQLKTVKTQVNEYANKLREIKREGEPNGIMLSINSLPKKAVEYLRLYRDVQVTNALLEFIYPLYEQSRFEENKNIPVLQIIDKAVPPAKKSFPPRSLLSIVIGLGAFLLSFIVIIISENPSIRNSEKVIYIKNNMFKWKVK
ncbi:MAG: GumC family protein [archaeon]